MTQRIGFMQGRLSPQVDGKIQAFPVRHWREEFGLAEHYGFPLIEWTLDYDGLDDNPLLAREGRREILARSEQHSVSVRSLTGDCFMQAPFYKAEGAAASKLLDMLRRVLDAAAELRLAYVVMPLVDNGRLEKVAQTERLHNALERLDPMIRDAKMKIVFESDLPPDELRRFIADFPPSSFGINYDIGNSASLDYDPSAEIGAYGARIDNVHVKDQLIGGSTVPLGTGNADLPHVFRLLRETGYLGDFILQTARAEDGRHASVLCRYRDMVSAWLEAPPKS